MPERIVGDVTPDTPTATVQTRPGSLIGTVNYLSPEQIRNQQADARADIFALGCVLYEMVTGRRAFARETAAETMTDILNADPPSPSALGRAIPSELERVISRCLEKTRENRFQSARDLSFVLKITLESPKARAVPAKSASSKVMLAVLPFENLSSDPEQEYFSDGMTEEMIAQLARIQPKQLGVIARTSAMRYKNTDYSIDQIARELGVDYILEGSVRRAHDNVRITAELIQVSDQTHLWAQRYDRNIEDVFGVQTDVTERIAGSLVGELLPEEQAALAREHTRNPKAHDAYLKGRYHFEKVTQADCLKAIEYFERARDLDPDYSLAYAGIGDTYVQLAQRGALPNLEAGPKTKAAATRALEIDDTLAEPHVTMGWVRLFYDWEWTAGGEEFRRAIELNTAYSLAYTGYAYYLAVMGRHDDAIAASRRGEEHDPLSLGMRSLVGEHLYFARRHDEAIEQLQNALELDPNFAWTHVLLCRVFQAQGRYEEAIASLRKAGLAEEEVEALSAAHIERGVRGYWQSRLEQSEKRARQSRVPPHHFARLYAALG